MLGPQCALQSIMKIYGPVDCLKLFSPKTSSSHEEIWCVSLSQDLEVLFQMEVGPLQEGDWLNSQQQISQTLLKKEVQHMVVVRITQGPTLFEDHDWLMVHHLRHLSDQCDIQFYDYVKTNGKSLTSLVSLPG
jgi:hypothetical protein